MSTEEDARRHLHGRLTSREWWLLPIVSKNALRVVEVVEERHFPGRTGGFEAMILREEVMGVCAVALALKKRLPAARLSALLRELGGPMPASEVGGDEDMIAVLDPPADGDRDRSLARLVAFVDWLEAERQEGP